MNLESTLNVFKPCIIPLIGKTCWYAYAFFFFHQHEENVDSAVSIEKVILNFWFVNKVLILSIFIFNQDFIYDANWRIELYILEQNFELFERWSNYSKLYLHAYLSSLLVYYFFKKTWINHVRFSKYDFRVWEKKCVTEVMLWPSGFWEFNSWIATKIEAHQ